MIKVFLKRIRTFKFTIPILLFAGCAGQAVDPGVYDADISARLAKISSSIKQRKYVSNDDYIAIKEFAEKYPGSQVIRQTYIDTLALRKDYGTLETLLAKDSTGKLSREEQILLGKVYTTNGKYAESVAILEPIIDAEPNDLEVIGLLGKSYFYLDKPEKASPLFDRVWDRILAEKQIDSITMRGLIQFRDGDDQKAIETLLLAREIDPGHAAANNGLSRAYARAGNMEKAEFYRQAAVKAQDIAVAKLNSASQNVSNIVELENAWANKDHANVIAIARKLLPISSPEQKYVVYQYILESGKALGDPVLVQEATNELRKLHTR